MAITLIPRPGGNHLPDLERNIHFNKEITDHLQGCKCNLVESKWKPLNVRQHVCPRDQRVEVRKKFDKHTQTYYCN